MPAAKGGANRSVSTGPRIAVTSTSTWAKNEVRDRAVRAEEAEDVGADDDAVEQQTDGSGTMQTSAKGR